MESMSLKYYESFRKEEWCCDQSVRHLLIYNEYMLIFTVILIVIGTILVFFAVPALSPIPYFPSNKKDLSLILKMLSLKNDQVIVDLGAGDGIVIFAAAQYAFQKRLNTQFVAVEINPILYVLLKLRLMFHKNRKNIKIVFGNMFTLNYKNLLPVVKSQVTFYLYISPWLIMKAIEAIQQYRKEFTILSYMYPIENRKPVATGKGKHIMYRYLFT